MRRAGATAGGRRVRWGRERGFGTAESVVAAGLGLLVIVAALVLTRGLLSLTNAGTTASDHALAATWALDAIADEVALAGLGLPRPSAGGVDEAVELLAAAALAVRADFDRDDPASRDDPEAWLSTGARSSTGNDEVVVFLRRAGPRGGDGRALFEADLDSDDRISLEDGTVLARRDGVSEQIDAGPCARANVRERGVLYRVTFVHDARRAGSGRFRSVRPLADHVLEFRVLAFDRRGAPVSDCGGADTPEAVACRRSIRRIALVLEIEGAGRFRREVALAQTRAR